MVTYLAHTLAQEQCQWLAHEENFVWYRDSTWAPKIAIPYPMISPSPCKDHKMCNSCVSWAQKFPSFKAPAKSILLISSLTCSRQVRLILKSSEEFVIRCKQPSWFLWHMIAKRGPDTGLEAVHGRCAHRCPWAWKWYWHGNVWRFWWPWRKVG